ncbi:MAG: hypothetical protein ACI4UK_07765, partial [Floccifex sp.]
MKQLKLNLTNCHGIKKLNENIDFSDNNIAIIYAPNGTMKSSLAKTFEALRDGIPVEEKVFNSTSSYNITDEENIPISGDKIIVVNPFDENLFEGQGLLMANDNLRRKYLSIYKSIEEKKELLYTKVKEKMGYSTRSNFDVKHTMLRDWGFSTKEEYACRS